MSGLHLQDRKTLVFSNHQSDKGIDGTIGNRAWPSLNGGSLEIIILYLTSLKITCLRHFIKLVKSHFFMWKSLKSHSLKYQKSTTQACKDIEIRNHNLWRMFSSFCVFYVTYKGSKKSFSLQTTMKMFSGFMFGVKKYQNRVRKMLNFFLTQTTQNKIL